MNLMLLLIIKTLLLSIFLGVLVCGFPLKNNEEQDYNEDILTEKVFKSVDVDKDGGITFGEAMDAVERGNKCFLGREHQLEAEFMGMDQNGDASIQLDEALAAQNGTFHTSEPGKEPSALFKEIDHQQSADGSITMTEFVAYIAKQMRQREEEGATVREGFVRADKNGDGKLGLDEVLAMEEANKRGQAEFNRFDAAITVAAMQFDCQ